MESNFWQLSGRKLALHALFSSVASKATANDNTDLNLPLYQFPW